MATELVDRFKQHEAGMLEQRADSHAGFGVHDARLEQRVVGLDAKLERRVGHATLELREEMRSLKVETRRWMLFVWVGTIVPLAGMLLGAVIVG